MKYRVGIALATVIFSIALLSEWIVQNGTKTTTDNPVSAPESDSGDRADVPAETPAMPTVDLAYQKRPEADDAARVFGRVSPAEIEDAVLQRIAELSGLELTSLTSVECDKLRCSIVFTGLETNPQYTDEYSELLGALMNPPWNDYQPTSGSIGTREISPGAREYVLGFTYVALVEASDDPEIAARQHAACAGAWARVTQQRGSSDYIRMAHDRAAEYLDLAAGVIGPEEAQRAADALQFGPLTRECHAAPY